MQKRANRPTVNSRKCQHLRGSYIWSPAEGKGGGTGYILKSRGFHPRPATAKTRSPSRQEQRRSRAVRGDLIPHRSTSPLHLVGNVSLRIAGR